MQGWALAPNKRKVQTLQMNQLSFIFPTDPGQRNRKALGVVQAVDTISTNNPDGEIASEPFPHV